MAGKNLDSDLAFVKLLQTDYPAFRFCFNKKRFSYRHSLSESAKSSIFLGPPQPNFALYTLHELGHALSNHKDYTTGVERLKIESEAWERAKTVWQKYQKLAKTDPNLQKILPKWDDNLVQSSLDTYRDWLHAKSKCKNCGLTMYQTRDGAYHCPRCEAFC